jgi:hypothetical protein
MQRHRADTDTRSGRRGTEAQLESSIAERLSRLAAMLTAHCLVTETLIHTLCFEDIGISRTRIVDVLNLVYEQLEEGLGSGNETVKAFSEQRDSLRSLLVTSVIRADLQMQGDLQSTT